MHGITSGWTRALLATTALAMGTASALAQDINTVPSWDGSNLVWPWGEADTATYGQTITATATQFLLREFTFYLRGDGGTPPNYQAMVYEWDATNQRIVGPLRQS